MPCQSLIVLALVCAVELSVLAALAAGFEFIVEVSFRFAYKSTLRPQSGYCKMEKVTFPPSFIQKKKKKE